MYKLRKQLILCFSLLLSTVMISCTSSKKQESKEDNAKTEQLVGSDRDEHGCISSAGYRWSVVLNDCIRPFEKGVKIPSVSGEENNVVYLVFNPDKSKVEVFLPCKATYPVMNSTDGKCWSSDEDSTFMVKKSASGYDVYVNGELMYKSSCCNG